MMLVTLLLALSICLSVYLSTASAYSPGSSIVKVTGYTQLNKGKFGSALYSVVADGSTYSSLPMLIDLHGPNAFSQGYDMGYLLGKEFIENYNSLMVSMYGDEWWEPAVQKLTNLLLDWQWKDYLSKQVPQDYMDEISGLTAGGVALGLDLKKGEDVGKVASRGVALANLPGSLENFIYILKDEKENPAASSSSSSSSSSFFSDASLDEVRKMSDADIMAIISKLKKGWAGLTCSMFGTWGSRTEEGRVFTGRNLDWLSDTGISKYKLITVHHPIGKIAHATFGWAGIWGSITGMSGRGITTHEANLESNDITYRGFPWVLRLREVMSRSLNLKDALSIWSSTNNTVGFNHGIGSAIDRKAVLLETMMHNTAVFYDNDEREKELIVNGVNIAAAREDAVYRTNHGYDSYTVSHYMWNNTNAYQDSIDRYMAFPEAFDSYKSMNKLITPVEAINITAILGHKGGNMYNCGGYPYNGGSNILSVTYDPTYLSVYAAWEDGRGSNGWSPAACNSYLSIDMTQWLK